MTALCTGQINGFYFTGLFETNSMISQLSKDSAVTVVEKLKNVLRFCDQGIGGFDGANTLCYGFKREFIDHFHYLIQLF